MDLHLVRDRDRAADREGQLGLLGPSNLKAGVAAGLHLGPQVLQALLPRGIGVCGPTFVRDAAVVEEPHKPRLPLALGLNVGPHHVLRVVV